MKPKTARWLVWLALAIGAVSGWIYARYESVEAYRFRCAYAKESFRINGWIGGDVLVGPAPVPDPRIEALMGVRAWPEPTPTKCHMLIEYAADGTVVLHNPCDFPIILGATDSGGRTIRVENR